MNAYDASPVSRWRYLMTLGMLLLCAFGLSARLIWWYVANPTHFPIRVVKIAAPYQRVSQKMLSELLNTYVNTESFFSLPTTRLKQVLSGIVWVKKVSIERVWPDVLKISLTEKVPIAIWRDTHTGDGWLTKNAEVLHQSSIIDDKTLPMLSGPINQASEVLQIYQKMSKILSIYGLQAISLVKSENGAWDATLSSGAVLRLGKRDIDGRMNRFCKAYQAVFEGKLEQLNYVDLRYPRGMAVQWKT